MWLKMAGKMYGKLQKTEYVVWREGERECARVTVVVSGVVSCDLVLCGPSIRLRPCLAKLAVEPNM